MHREFGRRLKKTDNSLGKGLDGKNITECVMEGSRVGTCFIV
jgi:hypothetical protein